MKRMVFGLSLALAAVGFLGSPAFAAGPQQHGAQALSSADQDFLASLAAEDPSAGQANRPPAGGGEKALCSATASCGGGVTVSCNSNSGVASCSSADRSCPERGHVTCNGVTTWCPDPCPCSATVSCGAAGGSVSCPTGTTSCSAVNRRCAVNEPGHVTCDGVPISCPACGCGAEAVCGNGAVLSCEGTSNCSGADTNCPFEQGHVTCNGSTTQWCSPACCSIDCASEEWACAMSCGSCPYSFSCNEVNCTQNCRCGFSPWGCNIE